jgi:hypothetical protein
MIWPGAGKIDYAGVIMKENAWTMAHGEKSCTGPLNGSRYPEYRALLRDVESGKNEHEKRKN